MIAILSLADLAKRELDQFLPRETVSPGDPLWHSSETTGENTFPPASQANRFCGQRVDFRIEWTSLTSFLLVVDDTQNVRWCTFCSALINCTILATVRRQAGISEIFSTGFLGTNRGTSSASSAASPRRMHGASITRSDQRSTEADLPVSDLERAPEWAGSCKPTDQERIGNCGEQVKQVVLAATHAYSGL